MIGEGRLALDPTDDAERSAHSAEVDWKPEQPLAHDPRNIWCTQYGLTDFGALFTPRQLISLTAYCDLVGKARTEALSDGASVQYADSIATYLALIVGKMADFHCSLCTWNTSNENISHVFTKQAIPMAWGFAEANPIWGSLSPEWLAHSIADVVRRLPIGPPTVVAQRDAQCAPLPRNILVATDPPYSDNISYAALSDFFYVWLRRAISSVYPALFSTLVVPKGQELIADPYRFEGSKKRAQQFFENGFAEAMEQIRSAQNPAYPMIVFYAFKQSEDDSDADLAGLPTVASTGWENMLERLSAEISKLRLRGQFEPSAPCVLLRYVQTLSPLQLCSLAAQWIRLLQSQPAGIF